MTHPTLGYTNFRFDGDDAVHMAAFNGAGHVIACNAEGPTEHDLWPHGVDAPVDCENCLRARESDWWMAQAEQQRREGAEAVWPEPTLDDVKDVIARGLSQVDAKVETAILWGDGDRTEPWLGVLSMNDPAPLEIRHGLIMPAADAAVLDAVKMKYHPDGGLVQSFDEASSSIVDDRRLVRGTRGPAMSSHFEDDDSSGLVQAWAPPQVAEPGSFLGEVIDRHNREAQQARYLARSPLSHLVSDAGKSGAPEEVLIGPQSMLRRSILDDAYEVARAEREQGYPDREEPPEVPDADVRGDWPYDCDRCNYDTHRCPGCGEPLTHGTEACAECNARIEEANALPPEAFWTVPIADETNVLPSDPDGWTELPAASSDVDTLPEPANWCHVHNRTTEAGREECSECDGERGEDRKAGES